MTQDFFSAAFVPGAIVYFSYDVPKGMFTSFVVFVSLFFLFHVQLI